MIEIYLSIICCCMPMMPGLFNRMFTFAANSVGVPSIVNQIWEKSFASTVGSDTLHGWSRRRSSNEPLGKWRTIRLPGRAARISGPFDSATGMELGHQRLETPSPGESGSQYLGVPSPMEPSLLRFETSSTMGVPSPMEVSHQRRESPSPVSRLTPSPNNQSYLK